MTPREHPTQRRPLRSGEITDLETTEVRGLYVVLGKFADGGWFVCTYLPDGSRQGSCHISVSYNGALVDRASYVIGWQNDDLRPNAADYLKRWRERCKQAAS